MNVQHIFYQTTSVSILGKPYCYFNSDFQGNFTTQVPYDNFIDEVEENQLDFHYSRVEIELDRNVSFFIYLQRVGKEGNLKSKKTPLDNNVIFQI